MRPRLARGVLAGLVVGLLVCGAPVWAADYNGPLIDAHSHLPNSTAIDAYVAAMKRHNVLKVVLLGAGGLQKDDTAWLTAASRKYPERVIAGLPLPDPTSESVVSQLELQLDRGKPRVIGEVHMRQVGRRLIDRDPNAAVFGKILDTAAKFAVPIVIHYELTDQAETALDRALVAHRKSTIVLAHGGEGPPGRLDRLLLRNPNLFIDLSGMHFQRTPALGLRDRADRPGLEGADREGTGPLHDGRGRRGRPALRARDARSALHMDPSCPGRAQAGRRRARRAWERGEALPAPVALEDEECAR